MSQLSPEPSKKSILSNQTYNVLKHVAAVGLPAVSTLYFALAQIWHFPDTEEVMGSIAAVNVFLGAFVGVSTLSYNNSGSKYVGAIEVSDDGSKKMFSLNLDGPPEDLESMSSATFKITPVPPTQNPPHLGA